ncbi:unnamed protein product [Acanthoscelides obtectus]|uniref:Uncharacterized protein n=1 Tax=Acanthoscelides obtectus TaxID=200917 RepID=A0A9P0JVF6_ACAOB|nr:unnamed protein product [Acanthoscelides obtectus]CAK1668980.1 hypothetical protein AOBTE_LOCUS26719 [Acanthoscelides obtectus]
MRTADTTAPRRQTTVDSPDNTNYIPSLLSTAVEVGRNGSSMSWSTKNLIKSLTKERSAI